MSVRKNLEVKAEGTVKQVVAESIRHIVCSSMFFRHV